MVFMKLTWSLANINQSANLVSTIIHKRAYIFLARMPTFVNWQEIYHKPAGKSLFTIPGSVLQQEKICTVSKPLTRCLPKKVYKNSSIEWNKFKTVLSTLT